MLSIEKCVDIIIGAGSMGMAAGYYLSGQGKSVLLLDEHDPPHEYGSHHGSSRIIRHAYGEGTYYVDFVLRAQELWKELEKLTGEKLFIPTGVVNMGKCNSHFIKNVIISAEEHHLPLDILNAKDLMNKWEGLSVPGNFIGCYEANSGVLLSEKCVSVFKREALKLGATLKSNRYIDKINVQDKSVTITANGEVFRSEKLIISAGAGTNKVMHHLNRKLPLETVRKTFSWFHTPKIYDQHSFPAFIVDSRVGTYYGFPDIDHAGMKIGRHDGGVKRDMNRDNIPFGEVRGDGDSVTAFSDQFFPELKGHKKGLACTYTFTPDGSFIIDHLPGSEHVLLACGFSGQGFKFSSVVGEVLSDLIVKGETKQDIRPFSLGRFRF